MKTIFFKMLTILAFLISISCSGGGGGGETPVPTPSITLQWAGPTAYVDATSLTVSGYKIYYGTESGNYTTVLNVGNVTSFTVPNLTANTTYYFVVTAYDAAGVESDPTDEQAKTLS